MIFISTGTTLIPFSRLIQTCVELFKNANQPVFIQSGNTSVPFVKGIQSKPFISNSEMIKKLKNAEIIICAAGEGSIFQILQHSRYRPILFPRLKKFGEHVDDQQLEIATYFQDKGLAYCATNTPELKKALKEKLHINAPARLTVNTQIINKLITFTEKI